MAVSTKTTPESAIKEGGSGVSPVLEPGNHEVKILTIEVRKSPDPKFGDQLNMQMETSPLPNFSGLYLDKNNTALGTYKGQVGYVGYNRFGFKDFLTSTNNQIYREVELQVAISDLCDVLGIKEWYEAQDLKHANMDALIAAMNAEKPFKDIFFHACIGGREYMNKQNYLAYQLFLVDKNRTLGYGYSKKKEKVQIFERAVHVLPLKKVDAAPPAAPPAQATPAPEKQILKDPTKPVIAPGLSELPFMQEGKTFTEQMNADATAQKEVLGKSPFISDQPKDPEHKDIILNPDMEKLPWE